MSSNLFDKTTDALASSLALRQIRHNVTSANIANAETPNYHAKKVDFEDALAKALDMDGTNNLGATHGDHFATGGKPAVEPGIYENPDVAVNNDGNTVDLEKEMSALAENSILYKSALQLINKKMAAMKYAISETR
ncbi:MAG: flagellar basal-body rod protein FlgB [Pseudobdellovibrio sp.]|jgi:flagellar basal-body rod protein FlgB|nr:flagellar basal-body rod protein FlgB [Pseudobdellovibrio sp.]